MLRRLKFFNFISVMYTIYTADLSVIPDVTTVTFADDTAIMASNKNPELTSTSLQNGLNAVNRWFQQWKIKASASKSVHVTFALRKGDCPPVKLGEDTLPHFDSIKYLPRATLRPSTHLETPY